VHTSPTIHDRTRCRRRLYYTCYMTTNSVVAASQVSNKMQPIAAIRILKAVTPIFNIQCLGPVVPPGHVITCKKQIARLV